jgi:hypothetical protein
MPPFGGIFLNISHAAGIRTPETGSPGLRAPPASLPRLARFPGFGNESTYPWLRLGEVGLHASSCGLSDSLWAVSAESLWPQIAVSGDAVGHDSPGANSQRFGNADFVRNVATSCDQARADRSKSYRTFFTAGGFQLPSMIDGVSSFGQYIRNVILNPLSGAGSQFVSLSAPGESCWMQISNEPSPL